MLSTLGSYFFSSTASTEEPKVLNEEKPVETSTDEPQVLKEEKETCNNENKNNALKVFYAIADEDIALYHYLTTKLREFFISQDFMYFHGQSKLDILSACEDPKTISCFNYQNVKYPHGQTLQLRSEQIILKNLNRKFYNSDKKVQGYFTEGASYRSEPNPVPGRHLPVFPLYEFEMFGDFEALLQLEENLLIFLGFPKPHRISYNDALILLNKKPTVDEITNEDEAKLCEIFNSPVLLHHFPIEHSYWNMMIDSNDSTLAKKCDVLLGMETIGSAERSCNVDEMRSQFMTISNGEYSGLLFKEFGRERVLAEFESYLNLPFVTRSGGGIGMTRLMNAYKKMETEKQQKAAQEEHHQSLKDVLHEIQQIPGTSVDDMIEEHQIKFNEVMEKTLQRQQKAKVCEQIRVQRD